ncbi:Mce protein [Mycolicibacillus parakoreensis]|uniref:Mce protein n=1 Tax=Mycolicibacillus parakoreensis TaxID=1069221 RepID=A0ABY3U390_9MYCO|nr:Mce protein [Mycolicibacillus parakoreensis]MCV7315667.1 Mce protein [Mycolicibacillus parakoreensis]ULN51894.1 Mce protein [Mycolicibacillus parakoreensis]
MSTISDVFDRLDELPVSADSDTAASDPEPGGAADEAGATGAGETAAPERPRRRRRRIVTVTAVTASAAALATIGYLGWRLHEVMAVDAAQQAALAAATDYAITLTTLDADTIDENYTRALDGATGEFKQAYSLGSAQLRQMLIDNDAAGTGVVVDAAVKDATATRAEVLLFVDQSITNAVRTEPRIDRNRIQMTMELVDGRWLASKVELT